MYLYLAVGGGPFEIRTHFVHGNVKLQYQPGKTMEPKPDSRHLKQCDKFCKIQCESIQLHNMKLTYNILDSLPIEVRNQPTSKDHPPIFFFSNFTAFQKKAKRNTEMANLNVAKSFGGTNQRWLHMVLKEWETDNLAMLGKLETMGTTRESPKARGFKPAM